MIERPGLLRSYRPVVAAVVVTGAVIALGWVVLRGRSPGVVLMGATLLWVVGAVVVVATIAGEAALRRWWRRPR